MIGAAGLFATSSFPFQSYSEYGWGLLGIETMGNWKLLWDICWWQGKIQGIIGDALMMHNCEKKKKN